MNKELTFIIQGKINKNSIQNLPCYLSYGKVIISCWKLDDIEILSDYKNVIKIVQQQEPPDYIFNRQNALQQILTTLNGLDICDTKYVIKVRSDEYYTDFNKFINKLHQYPNKIITNNVFFRFPNMFKYHISDHVIGGLTENLRIMFNSAYDRLMNRIGEFPVEVLLSKSYLYAKGVKIDQDKSSYAIMKKYFDMIHIKDMGKILIKYNEKKMEYTDYKLFLKEHGCIQSIKDLREIIKKDLSNKHDSGIHF